MQPDALRQVRHFVRFAVRDQQDLRRGRNSVILETANELTGNLYVSEQGSLYALLDDMHRIAEDHQCFLEGRIHEPATDAYWE